ncbi:hypothetical protein FA15DRAFT_670909 [Coprinopsis marcescibilis]|uniref:Uncharacterized protein n=1 Tax=Coprinopsis marcescibilis TaxID=230819 RepID=A0A5C3KR47_COPMA|nr:hypothetical protein FA15DRAFT_670909 [Coprinopsis marcescibilis]
MTMGNVHSDPLGSNTSFDKDHERLKSREAQRAQGRQKIDDRIEQLEQLEQLQHELLNLKVERNQLSITAQLPPEILSRIFFFVERSSMLGIPGYGRPRWVGVTYVSRRWRGVTLGTPSLWSNIELCSLPWIRAMLERSQPLPIAIEAKWMTTVIEPPRSIMVDIGQVLKPHGSRLDQLQLSAQRRDLLEQFLDTLPTSLPNLCTLSIKNDGHDYTLLRFPQKLFIDGVPKLRDVRLAGCHISWKFRLFQGLTSLHVSTCTKSPGPSEATIMSGDALQSADDFLKALESMPMLEVLSIDFIVPDFSEMEREPIQLPCLRQLYLGAPLSDIADVLQLISIPTSAHVKFHSFTWVGTVLISDAIPEFVAALHCSWLSAPLAPSGSSSPPPCMKNLEIYSDEYRWILDGWFTDVATPTNKPFEFELDLRGPGCTSEELSEVLSHLPLGGLRTLGIVGSITTEDMVPIGQWQSLRHISLDGTVIKTFLEYMETDPSLGDGSSSTPTYLGSLEVLKIIGADFYGTEYPDTLSVEVLLDFLMIRYEFGSPIRSLELLHCFNLDESEVETIRHIIGDMGTQWDGEVNVEEHEESDSDEDFECRY